VIKINKNVDAGFGYQRRKNTFLQNIRNLQRRI